METNVYWRECMRHQTSSTLEVPARQLGRNITIRYGAWGCRSHVHCRHISGLPPCQAGGGGRGMSPDPSNLKIRYTLGSIPRLEVEGGEILGSEPGSKKVKKTLPAKSTNMGSYFVGVRP